MEKRVLTVGFADLSYYAKLFELLPPEQAVGVLLDAVTAAGEAIVSGGGTLRKYIGDAILFTFDDARRAVEAANAVAGSFDREVGALAIRYQVALATGEVLLVRLGHPALVIDDVLGATVNRAARLLAEARR